MIPRRSAAAVVRAQVRCEPGDRFGQRRRGEQRRVALARAVIGGLSLIVADEPTAHLDRANGAIVLQLLKRAAAEHGGTVIVSSHDPDALEAADEILPLGIVGSEGAVT